MSLLFTKLLLKYNKFIRNASTIYALSSGYGKCGVAVIRVSGENTLEALKSMTDLKIGPKPRTALLKNIFHPKSKELLDKGLVLWFPSPNSFTGEDCLEFQIHGGPAVVTAVLNALDAVSADFRLAEPGEFTKRALYNGKLDLVQVEGISDLLNAETEMQRKQALMQTSGDITTMYNNWQSQLFKCLSNVEAAIDFEETDHLDTNASATIANQIQEVYESIEKQLENANRGELLRDGVKVVLTGAPNAGKSSLMNVMCGRQAAIVHSRPGTTRDVLQTQLDITGYPLVLADTAGLSRSVEDEIELEGTKRAQIEAKQSQILLLVVDIRDFQPCDDFVRNHCDRLQLELLNEDYGKLVLILNKSDLLTENQLETIIQLTAKNDSISIISCKTKSGFDDFYVKLTDRLKQICGDPSVDPRCITRHRHRNALIKCSSQLEKALNTTHDLVLTALHLRKAIKYLATLTAREFSTEQILDSIFADFCIGK